MEERNPIDVESGIAGGESTEISAEDLARVEDSLAQAQQVRTQIQELQLQNTNYAWMLSLILRYMNDTTIPYLSSQINAYHISIPAMFCQVVPYLALQTNVDEYLQHHPDVAMELDSYDQSLTGVVAYLTQMRRLYPELTNYPVAEYSKFVAAFVELLQLIDRRERDITKNQEFLDSLAGQF